jgi:lambda repressor-like predicted transcriptional regulator
MNNSSNILKTVLEQDQLQPNDILYALSIQGFTPGQVAEACNVNPQTVSLVIHGKRRSVPVASFIAKTLNTSLKKLWGDAYCYTPRIRKQHAATA